MSAPTLHGNSPLARPRAAGGLRFWVKPDDVSTPEEVLGIGPGEAEHRRLALLAWQRWESEGGALQPENGTTGAPLDRRKVGVGTSCPQSPSGTDGDVRAESESSC